MSSPRQISDRLIRTFKRRPALLVTLFLSAVVVVCIFAYWPSYYSSFLLDDYKHLETTRGFISAPQNLVKVFSPYFNGWYYRPTTYLFFSLAQALFGLRPAAYYLALLAIHTINIILLYAIFRRLGISRLIALCAAAFFAITAPNQDVFGWISSASVPLAAMFALLAALCLVIYLQDDRDNIWMLLASAFFILLAMLSREESLILSPFAAFALLQAGAWRAPKRGELLIALVMTVLAAVYAYVILTRPTWTARGDVLSNITTLNFLSLSQLAAYLWTYASRYLPFIPGAILQFTWLSWLLVLLILGTIAVSYWKGGGTLRSGLIWWILCATFIYLFLWPNIDLAGRYLYLPWIGAALVFAVALGGFRRGVLRRPWQALLLLLFVSWLIVQTVYARAAQRPFQEYVATTSEIEMQTKLLLPDLDSTYHLFAYNVPPVPDYIVSMASVWYGLPLTYPGGYIGRLLEQGHATDSYYVLDYKDGRLYNLMPELQQAPQTVFLWQSNPRAEIVDNENKRRLLDEGAYKLDVVNGPAGQPRFGVFIHPPPPEEGWSSLTYDARVPENSALAFGLWKDWGGIEGEDGLKVRVIVNAPQSDSRTIYQGDLTAEEDHWIAVTIPLQEYGSQDVQIELQVAAGANLLHDHLYWANPRFIPMAGAQ